MKALLLILTAFFLQSCYTIIYSTDEYLASGDQTYRPSPPRPLPICDRPHRPYIPASPPENYLPTSAPVEEETARPRTNGPSPAYTPPSTGAAESRPRVEGSTRDTRTGNPAPPENPVRVRTSPPPPATAPAESAAPVRQETQAGNTAARERATTQPSPTEPRTRPR